MIVLGSHFCTMLSEKCESGAANLKHLSLGSTGEKYISPRHMASAEPSFQYMRFTSGNKRSVTGFYGSASLLKKEDEGEERCMLTGIFKAVNSVARYRRR